MTAKLTDDEKKQVQRLTALSDEEIAQRKAQLQREMAKLTQAAAVKKRKNETRKKILVGSYYWERAQRKPDEMKKIIAALDMYLTRADDRALFGLPPAPSAPETPEDPLTAAQRMTPNSADHGDPSKVVGRDVAEGGKNGQEAPKVVSEEEKPEKKKWGVF